MFRQAIIDDYNEEIDSIPTNDKLMETLSFSPEFEIRMNKLFAKERRRELFTKVLFYSKQIAAMFILTFAVVFSLLLINPEVRAAVKSIVIEWRDKFTSIIFQSNKSSNMSDEKEWQFEYLPFGYQEYKIDKFGLITNMEYVNGQDQFIYFSYQPDGVNSSISIDNENHEIESTMINGTSGYIAKATDDDYENGIIWTMNGYTFSLWSQLQVEELIKIVESIRVK
ncbi:MAG: hypothetical protein K0R00_2089 [Herbinix sp.]|jgi:hypothetical protein|nr:hypothetical protein [Herbinix sp.]